ncbi:MAG: tetratricopeptide repeat protein [Chloroflexi bacterium]|nr:tetratricopeptide repeat protein [Chloroflexota bacterium]
MSAWLHALAAMGDERWEEAITAWQHFVRLEHRSENRRTGYQNLSACYLALERFDEALAALDQVERLVPGSPDTVHDRGVIYACAGRISEAIDVLSLYARRWPQEARRLETSNALHRLQQIRNGELPAGDYLVGHLQEQISHNVEMGDWRLVEGKARRMIAANPSRPEGHFALGVACVEQGRYREALEALFAADARDQECEPTLYNIGYTLLQLGEPESALGWLERALRRDPNHLATLQQLAQACDQLGRRDEAVAWWQRALNIDPHFELAQERLHELGQGPKPVAAPLPPSAQELRALAPVVKACMTRPESYRNAEVTLTLDGQVGYVLEDAGNPLNGSVYAGGPFRTASMEDPDVLDLMGIVKLVLKQINVENTRTAAVLIYYADRPSFHYEASFRGSERAEQNAHGQFVVTEVPRLFKLRIDSDLGTPYGDPMKGTIIYLKRPSVPGILVSTLGLEPRRPMPAAK